MEDISICQYPEPFFLIFDFKKIELYLRFIIPEFIFSKVISLFHKNMEVVLGFIINSILLQKLI